ncbi:Cadherin-23 [Armadillidium vulgare]|nr:Cadherin-23 [Armadillidium vulgare]
MKGYFDFEVFVNDTDGLSDRSRVFIYLLREDQRVKIILRMRPEEVRNSVHYLRESLSNITGAIVNVDAFKVHENEDGTVDKTKTDLFLHLVNREDHSVLEVSQVLAALDKNVNLLDSLFKELNVLDTQGAQLRRLSVVESNLLFVWLVGVVAFLSLLLIATISLCLAQRARYARQLKAATVTAFGSQDTGLNRSSTVPNTNLHSVEGSNPIWMSGFDNDWFKDEESLRYHHFIHHSDNGDSSLDNNAVDSSLNRDLPYLTHTNVPNPDSRESSLPHNGTKGLPTERISNLSDTYRSNIYQTFNKIGNPLVDKKLETTEL